MKQRLKFLLALLFTLPVYGQTSKLDSLKTVLSNPPSAYAEINALNSLSRELFKMALYDSSATFAYSALQKSTALNYGRGMAMASLNFGYTFLSTGQVDTASYYFDLSLVESQKIGDFKGVAAAYNSQGNILLSLGEYDEAAEKYTIALKIRSRLNDRQGVADCLSNLGIISFYQAKFEEALKFYLAGLSIFKDLGNQTAIARAYSNIGGIYLQLGDNENALETFQKGLLIQKELDDNVGMGRSYNNIATVYFSEKKYDLAMENFLIALKIKEEAGDWVSIGQTYINIGNIYFTKISSESDAQVIDSLTAQAENFYNQALEVFTALGDKQSMAMAYNCVGSVQLQKGEPSSALPYLNKGLELAREVGSVDDLRLSYFRLAAADSALGNWARAFEHRKLYQIYQDSMLNAEAIRNTTTEKLNFEFEEQQIKDQAEQDKKEGIYLEKIKWQTYLAWILAITFLLIVLALLQAFNRRRLMQENSFQQKFAAQQKQQATVIMETQEQERKRIAEDLHDSLGQMLSTVKMNLQTLPEDQKKFTQNSLQLLNNVSAEIRNISFNLMPQTLEEAGLMPALYELADKVKQSGRMEIVVQAYGINQLKFEKQMEFNIYRIVQEVVNNAIKHANAKEINIQLVKLEESISIMIEDDGKGFDPLKLTTKGRGLRNITARSQWLQGNISIDSYPGKGTTIFIEIPYKN